MQTLSRATAVLGATGVLALAGAATPASAAGPRASYQLNEPSGATVMHDISGHGLNGRVGAHVSTGIVVGGHTGYRWPLVGNDPAAPADPQHLATVPDTPRLRPGAGAYTVTVTFRFGTAGNNRNLVQKGQEGDPLGFFKLESGSGNVACQFTGDAGSRRVTTGPVAGNRSHTVTCARTATGLRLILDGKLVGTAAGPSGNIVNSAPLSIGGKPDCAQATVECDYYVGFMDRVLIS